jgi:hypothetical protein
MLLTKQTHLCCSLIFADSKMLIFLPFLVLILINDDGPCGDVERVIGGGSSGDDEIKERKLQETGK